MIKKLETGISVKWKKIIKNKKDKAEPIIKGFIMYNDLSKFTKIYKEKIRNKKNNAYAAGVCLDKNDKQIKMGINKKSP